MAGRLFSYVKSGISRRINDGAPKCYSGYKLEIARWEIPGKAKLLCGSTILRPPEAHEIICLAKLELPARDSVNALGTGMGGVFCALSVRFCERRHDLFKSRGVPEWLESAHFSSVAVGDASTRKSIP